MIRFSCAIEKNHDDGIIIGHKTDWTAMISQGGEKKVERKVSEHEVGKFFLFNAIIELIMGGPRDSVSST